MKGQARKKGAKISKKARS